MIPQRRLLVLALALGLVVGASGCSSPALSEPTPPPEAGAGAPAPTPAAEARAVEIEVDADRMLTMPTRLPAGAHVFRVRSSADAEVVVIAPRAGYTAQDLAADLGPHDSAEAEAAAARRLDERARFLGGAWSAPDRPGVFARTLTAGNYWFVDLSPEAGGAGAGGDRTLEPTDVVSVTVTGTPAATALPAPDAVADATEDRSWSLPETLPAAGTLLLRNGTEASHHLVIEPVPPDVPAAEWLALTRAGRGVDCTCHSPARLSAGTAFFWSYDLPPGDYLVMDLSTSELGYRQFNGAGATIVELTRRAGTGVSASAENGRRAIHSR